MNDIKNQEVNQVNFENDLISQHYFNEEKSYSQSGVTSVFNDQSQSEIDIVSRPRLPLGL